MGGMPRIFSAHTAQTTAPNASKTHIKKKKTPVRLSVTLGVPVTCLEGGSNDNHAGSPVAE